MPEYVTGIKETKKQFEKLNRAVQTRVLRKALGAAGKLIKSKMQVSVRVLTGALKRSLGIRRKAKGGKASVVVGPRVRYQDKKTGKIPNKYASAVEFGDDSTPPQSFVRSTAEQEYDAVVRLAQQGVVDAVKEVTIL